MKKSFTLIELIFVIVIMGILSNITFDILSKLYQNYMYTKEMNKLNSKLDATIDIISKKLQDRVRNSVIVTKYPATLADTDNSKVDFKSIAELTTGDSDYKIIEWIGKDFEAKNGMWNSEVNHIQIGWSEFIDLGYKSHRTNKNQYPKEYNVTTINSIFNIVELIDRNITASYGFNDNPFDTNTTTLIFSGNDGGGDIVNDLNQSYGWYLDEDKNRSAKAVFAIQGYYDYKQGNTYKTDLNITSISENNDTTLYARYFLTRTAYAIVPIENNDTTCTCGNGATHDYNLTFVYNYQPWQGDWWNGGAGESNTTLIATHITEIKFKKDIDTPMIRLYICMQSPNVEINSTDNLKLCKEKAIF